MPNLPLFEPENPPLRVALARRLGELAREGVLIGTSSWKYEGWLGQIYTPERYMARGRPSRKKFEQACVSEYAEVFPIVCGDFSFYQVPSPDYGAGLFAATPPAFQFAFKAPEEITVRVWPGHARYGSRRGSTNESFLNPALFERLFLGPLEPFRRRVAVLIFEFGAFSGFDRGEFLERLDTFLRVLPAGWRYGVEIRNPEFLSPQYFACLAAHGVAHVFNAWTRMPELLAQLELPGAWTTGFSVTRALLSAGRFYQQAVARFEPYAVVRQPNEKARDGLRRIIEKSRQEKRTAYIFVNNRLEGNAPGTIAAVVGVDA